MTTKPKELDPIDNSLYQNMSVDDGLLQSLVIVLRSLAVIDRAIWENGPTKENVTILESLTKMLNDLKKEERLSLKEMEDDK